MVFDWVGWSDRPVFHNALVVGSSPTSSTTQSHIMEIFVIRGRVEHLAWGILALLPAVQSRWQFIHRFRGINFGISGGSHAGLHASFFQYDEEVARFEIPITVFLKPTTSGIRQK